MVSKRDPLEDLDWRLEAVGRLRRIDQNLAAIRRVVVLYAALVGLGIAISVIGAVLSVINDVS